MTAIVLAVMPAAPAPPGIIDDPNPPVLATGGERHQSASIEEVVAVAAGLLHVEEGVNANRARQHGTALLLDYLSGFAGTGWQQRWEASPLEAAGPSGFRAAICNAAGRPPTAAGMWLLTNGLGTLMALDVVRPSLDFVLGARLNHTWSHLLTWRHDPNADVLRRVRCTPQTRAAATGLLGRLVVVTALCVSLDQATHEMAHPKITVLDADGQPAGDRRDLVIEEEDAFWGFAVIEVLRHTGVRVEELLELTQLDLHDYDHRDPAIGKVLLLHINPSKQDRERMVVIAPELAAVFAAMARRVRAAVGATGTALPSLVAYDYAECVDSDPLPFLFQRTAGKGFKGTTAPMHKTYVARVLNKVVRAAGLTGPDGNVIGFTPHDFRRIFATDALAAGLPPHIIQKLMGHASLATTQGYAAIFPEDVIRSHRAFIHNRRGLRPADEYRDVGADEWDEFEEHFAKRKIAIGDCMRAYGTNCVHEYACEQCKLARPDAGAQPRLERTRQGLHDQIEEAGQRGWLGEVERLSYILVGVDEKLAEIDRVLRRTTWARVDPPATRKGDR